MVGGSGKPKIITKSLLFSDVVWQLNRIIIIHFKALSGTLWYMGDEGPPQQRGPTQPMQN